MTERTIDAHERFAAEALLRAVHTYQEARQRAQEVGGDLSIAPELPVSGFEESASRYDELLYHWTIGPRAAENRRRGRAGARSSGHHHRSRRALPVCRRVANRLGGARSWLYSAGHRRRA